ncbi:hypothetical protein HPP92_009035 [Vanilla planifolia]|uniref:Vacuolar iron transporter n=1 Tax=Vanilla planifolia TaxID=51239 RepID=A0A835V7S9_VANPL|nr:hypothetical protein HPP92_009035 [Vanilla planifolia]
MAISETKIIIPNNESQESNMDDVDYTQRGQWLRAAVLGANDGLVSTASLIMGVGAVKDDVRAMILSGSAGLVAGACSMAIGEFVSVYSQLDIEVAQLKREKKLNSGEEGKEVDDASGDRLPSPIQAAMASALSFSIGAAVPLLAAGFIRHYTVRLVVVAIATTIGLAVFGWIGAVLGRAPALKSASRVLLGGWLAMAVTFAFMKTLRTSGF